VNPSLLDVWHGALATAAAVSAPFLAVALVVGLGAALLQAATQLQENVLAFVPKVIAIGLALALLGPWALERLSRYGTSTMDAIVTIGREAGK
jgi:flagellar biosynthetic protein FliQ